MNCRLVRVAVQLTYLEPQQHDHMKQRRREDKNQVCGDSSISVWSAARLLVRLTAMEERNNFVI